jgi:hypothetical protein
MSDKSSQSHSPTAHLADNLLVLDDGGVQTLGVLDVDGLYVRVQLLLGALLVVTLTGDADAQAVGNAFDTGLPDLLVELGIQANVTGALLWRVLANLSHVQDVETRGRQLESKSALFLRKPTPLISPSQPFEK